LLAEESCVFDFEKWREFWREAKMELKKTVFPSRSQTMGASVGLLVLVFFVALYLGVLDFAFSKLITKFLTF